MHFSKLYRTLILLGISFFIPHLAAAAGESFSFLVVGDTRTEPYLTGGPAEEAQIRAVLQERYFSEAKTAKLTFDPATTELVEVEYGEKPSTTMSYKDGWPRFIVNKEKGKSLVVMRDGGRKWVFNRIVSAMDRGASFIVHGGDIPLFGFQGKSLAESPYWQLFEDELLSRLPKRDKTEELPGNFFAAVGNHATWGDDEISGFITTLPWLAKLGLNAEKRIYSFSYRNNRFIFLDSGKYNTSGETAWTSIYPDFSAQMAYLTKELKAAKADGNSNVFVIYHKPSFVKVGHPPLPKDQNPHFTLKRFAKELNIYVFNSHTHTTERYLVDGINYLVLGGGGAPQKFALSDDPSPEPELYWKGKKRVEEYNYLRVQVDNKKISGTLHRFRPTDPAQPFTTAPMFSPVGRNN